MTDEDVERTLELLAADVRVLRHCVILLMADKMRAASDPNRALQAFSKMISTTLERNAPAPDSGSFATRCHEIALSRFDELIAGVRALVAVKAGRPRR